MAVAVFTVLPVVKKQINLAHTDTVTDTIGVTDTTSYASPWASRECYPSAASGGTDPSNTYDGSYITYGTAYNNQTMTISFSESNYGTVTRLIFWITAETGGNNIDVTSDYGTCSPATINSSSKTTFRVTIAIPTNSWTPNIKLTAATSETATIYEVTATVEYMATLTKSGSVSKSGSAVGAGSLTGNSSADTVIGELVTADVQGYQDDGGGTYTGTPSALIERPDHVFKHILIALLGEAAGDIGSSFATSGTLYSSTYKLAFILHEVATEADRLLQELAFQCRSKFVEFRGKFELVYLSTVPTASKTFTDDDCLEEPSFGYTPEIDIRNAIYVKYKRDYRESGSDAYDAIQPVADGASITQNGLRVDSIELSACRTLAMASNWATWYLTQKKQEWRTLDITVPWIGKVLVAGNTFILTWDFFNGVTWDIQSVNVDYMHEKVTFTAQEWPA
jgi:hypothetical protein